VKFYYILSSQITRRDEKRWLPRDRIRVIPVGIRYMTGFQFLILDPSIARRVLSDTGIDFQIPFNYI
jgi:hypothetical protein